MSTAPQIHDKHCPRKIGKIMYEMQTRWWTRQDKRNDAKYARSSARGKIIRVDRHKDDILVPQIFLANANEILKGYRVVQYLTPRQTYNPICHHGSYALLEKQLTIWSHNNLSPQANTHIIIIIIPHSTPQLL